MKNIQLDPFVNELFGKNVEESLIAADFKVKKNGNKTEFFREYGSHKEELCLLYEELHSPALRFGLKRDQRREGTLHMSKISHFENCLTDLAKKWMELFN